MAEQERKREPIKITDRRTFTREGERRSPAPDETRSESGGSSATIRGKGFEMRPQQGPEPQPGGGSLPGVDFNAFILSLTSTAFIHLGEMEDPVTKKTEVRLDAARQIIDIIDMLHAKTTGNLEPQEEEFIKGILFELKMKYAQTASRE